MGGTKQGFAPPGWWDRTTSGSIPPASASKLDAAGLKSDSVFAACSHSEAAILSAVHPVTAQLLKGFDVPEGLGCEL